MSQTSYIELIAKKHLPDTKITVKACKLLHFIIESTIHIFTARAIETRTIETTESKELTKDMYVTVSNILIGNDSFFEELTSYSVSKYVVSAEIVVKNTKPNKLQTSAISLLQSISEAMLVDILMKSDDISEELNVIDKDDIFDAIQLNERYDFIANLLLKHTEQPSQIPIIQGGDKRTKQCEQCIPSKELHKFVKKNFKVDITVDGLEIFKSILLDIIYNVVRNSEMVTSLDKSTHITYANVLEAIHITQGVVTVPEKILISTCKKIKTLSKKDKLTQKNMNWNPSLFNSVVLKAKTPKTPGLTHDAKIVLHLYIEMYALQLIKNALMINKLSTRTAINSFDIDMVKRIRYS